MDDFLSESEQWELVKRWMRVNAPWIVGGVVLGVIGLAGWRMWLERVERLAMEARGRYAQALAAFSRGARTRGYAIVDELRRDHDSSPYANQGELLAARVHVDAGEYDKAAERLNRVMTDAHDAELATVARGRLARVRLGQGNPDEALALLKGIAGGAFAPQFDEIRGDALVAKGDREGALTAYRAARAGATEGIVDPGLLELKMVALEPATASQPAPAPAPAPAKAN